MESAQRFLDRVVVVTGAASGIGAETARRFAREGAKLLLADLETDGGERVAADTGGVFQETDVTDEAQVCALLVLARVPFQGTAELAVTASAAACRGC